MEKKSLLVMSLLVVMFLLASSSTITVEKVELISINAPVDCDITCFSCGSKQVNHFHNKGVIYYYCRDYAYKGQILE